MSIILKVKKYNVYGLIEFYKQFTWFDKIQISNLYCNKYLRRFLSTGKN